MPVLPHGWPGQHALVSYLALSRAAARSRSLLPESVTPGVWLAARRLHLRRPHSRKGCRFSLAIQCQRYSVSIPIVLYLGTSPQSLAASFGSEGLRIPLRAGCQSRIDLKAFAGGVE